MKLRNWFGTDELAVVRFCMRMIFSWPENSSWWKKVLRFVPPISAAAFDCFVWWFLLFEAASEGMPSVLQSLSDALGVLSFVVRGVFLLRYADEIYYLSKMIKDFKRVQNGIEGVRIQRPLVAWMPCILFAVQCAISVGVSIYTMLEPPDRREPSLRVPSVVVHSDYYFRSLMSFFAVMHWPVYFVNVTTEALIIGLSTTLCEKAETMKRMLLCWSNNSTQEQEFAMNNIVQYHIMIAELRDRAERILSGPLLYQLFFILVSLGTPGLRILLTELKPGILGFMAVYVLWISAQIIIYCEMCEQATNTCSGVAFSAYSVYHPSLTRSITQKLLMIMVRAQRPMHLTARRLFKLNRRTLLGMYKQSYRFYSAILNLR